MSQNNVNNRPRLTAKQIQQLNALDRQKAIIKNTRLIRDNVILPKRVGAPVNLGKKKKPGKPGGGGAAYGPSRPGENSRASEDFNLRKGQTFIIKGTGDYTTGQPKEKKKKKKKKEWWEQLISTAGKTIREIAPMVMAGLGDYDLDTNSVAATMTNGKIGNEVPMMENTKCVNIIRHREYIGDVYSTTSLFATQTFPINPGMQETFPWGSFVANNYENYRFRGLIFEFKSEGSEFSNAVGLGYVALATQYNSQATGFSDKKAMLNHEFANSAKPSESFIHPVECAPQQLVLSELYTRAGAIPADADKRMYDIGILTLAAGGMTADGVVIGELWASYELEFYVPKASNASGVNILYEQINIDAGASGTTPLGTQRTQMAFSTMTGTTTSTRYTFPDGTRGRFWYQFAWNNSSVSWVFPTTQFINCSSLSTPLALDRAIPNSPVTCTSQCVQGFVDVLRDGAALDLGVLGTVSVTGWITIAQVARAYTSSPLFDYLGKDSENRLTKVINDYVDDNDQPDDFTLKLKKEQNRFKAERKALAKELMNATDNYYKNDYLEGNKEAHEAFSKLRTDENSAKVQNMLRKPKRASIVPRYLVEDVSGNPGYFEAYTKDLCCVFAGNYNDGDVEIAKQANEKHNMWRLHPSVVKLNPSAFSDVMDENHGIEGSIGPFMDNWILTNKFGNRDALIQASSNSRTV
jgi:hypothetical protein